MLTEPQESCCSHCKDVDSVRGCAESTVSSRAWRCSWTGLGFGTSWAMWHKSISDAGPVNQLGKTETSQAQLEGSLENGRKQTQLYNQSHLQYPPYSPKRPLVKWRRPYVCSLPNSSNSQAKKACPKATTPRNVQLPQPGPATNGDYLIRKENWRQCPRSYSGLNTKPHSLHESRRTSCEVIGKSKHNPGRCRSTLITLVFLIGTITNLRPDLMLRSALQKILDILELMVLWESGVEESYEWESLS